MIGQTISHYQILEKLGEGGMGVVYKAQDTKLDRLVALKFLPAHVAGSEQDKARFVQEAKAAAALNHPNICTIYGIEESDEHLFIAMEYVDGITLRRKIAAGTMQIAESIQYASQIGEALQEAHSKGIVHRDVKPDNIMVNSRNQIKVMDFGLAKLKGSLRLTRTTSTVGTLAYMAPEQMHGSEVDARADLFSYAVLVFEMLTGRLPFRGEHEAALMYSILNEEPESVHKYRPELPSEFQYFFTRALEKDPDVRTQSAAEMVNELRRLQRQSTKSVRTVVTEQALSPDSTLQAESPKSRRTILWAAVGALLAGVVITAYVLFFSKPVQGYASIAVLPFVNASDDLNTEYLSDGITESIINNLSKLQQLRVVPRGSVFFYKDKDVTPLQAGGELNVSAVLTGRVVQRGENLNIQAELIDVRNNAQLWGEQYHRKMSDLVTLQDELSREIVNQLRLQLTGDEEKQFGRRTTTSNEAYELYLKGRYSWSRRTPESMRKSIDYFQQALEKDPTYTLAHVGLAESFVVLGDWQVMRSHEAYPKAKAAAVKALELDPMSGEAQNVLAMVLFEYDWDFPAAERAFKKAIELNPRYATSYQWYGEYLTAMGRPEEALSTIQKAIELDPLSLIMYTVKAVALLTQGKNEEAVTVLLRAREMDPNFVITHFYLDYAYSQLNQYDKAFESHLTGLKLQGVKEARIEELRSIYAREGVNGIYRLYVEERGQQWKDQYVSPVNIAEYAAMLGERERTFFWLEEAYKVRDRTLVYLNVWPTIQRYRSDPRFVALLKKIGLEK